MPNANLMRHRPLCRAVASSIAWLLVLIVSLTLAARATFAADDAAAPAAPPPVESTVEQLVEKAKPSVVSISFLGRDGQPVGVGTGFIVSADGLIATNLHVIGEARAIVVKTPDGKTHDVTTIHASDRQLDLALVKIEGKDLPALPLGVSKEVKQGEPIVVLGNPLGLERSVVTGVISGTRKIGESEMLQIAMPVEPGNSGGPVLDRAGRVVGIVTLKSAVTENLGFAMPIDAIKPLMTRPNPVPMSRWLTIGALDASQWETLMGAPWRQRAGRIIAEETPGSGFGGRSLCLSKMDAPKRAFEVAVSVRLNDEAGAAGLAFCSDGGDKHYGFYPSNGRLRLTRFDGANVFTWTVLGEKPSDSYHPGDWNTLKVRLEPKRILCYVNDELVIESDDDGLKDGRVGLAKFRQTRAEFRGFRVGEKLAPARPTEAQVSAIDDAIKPVVDGEEPTADLIKSLIDKGPTSAVLADRAKELEAQAKQLRQLAVEVHRARVRGELLALLNQDEAKIDLFHAALLIAKMDNEEVDVAAHQRELDRMAAEIAKRVPKDAPAITKVATLNKYLFEESGFHGSRTNYYNRSNSYMNEVLEDREGLPITLSVLYIELGRRIGLNVAGAPLPGHFMVQDLTDPEHPQLIDVFEGGKLVSRDEAALRVLESAGIRLTDEQLAPATKRDIILRMLYNLMGVARQEDPVAGPLPYLDAILAIDPDRSQERWVRAVLRYQTGQRKAAASDAAWLMEKQPDDIDMERVHRLYNAIEQATP